MQIPFGHINSDHLHDVCFDFVIGMLLILAMLLLFIGRMLLAWFVDFSLWFFLKSAATDDDDDDDGNESAGCDADDDDDDCGNDSAYSISGFDKNMSKPMNAYSNAVTKQCPSIRN